MEIIDETINLDIYHPCYKKVITKPMEELVNELVVCSMPLTFHIEALKCQSIIMRTLIAKELKFFNARKTDFSHESDISLEVFKKYLAVDMYSKLANKKCVGVEGDLLEAILETSGLIICFNNRPIEARFHMVCGGSTENSENVDGNVVQYLRKVLCRYCKDTPYSFNYKDINIEDIENKLDVKFAKEDSKRDMEMDGIFEEIHRDKEGRIIQLKVGGKVFVGKHVMNLLELNSTRFNWRPEKIRFFTSGKGDGVGLCQYGANQMAIEGKKAEEILKYYYTGISLKKIEINDMKTPLKGKAIMIDPAHGGDNTGDNIGFSGSREKDINLDISLYLRQSLEELGAKVYMTRTGDVHVPITKRAAMANSHVLDFFVSIHQNFFKNPARSGTEIYYFRGDKEAKKLGEEIIREITQGLNTINRGLKTADFFLLRDVKISSLHIELAYISNPQDESLLMKENYKKLAALAIANGFARYYGCLI